MYRPRHPQSAPRRGIILLIVLALLTLFAIVGISFVLYANSEANGSRYFRESEAPPQPDMDPELLISMFLGQLIYDVDDDTGIYSAMRGHSLARNMYGYYYQRPPAPGINDQPFQNIYAFNGTGRLRGGAWPPPSPTWARPLRTPDGAPSFDDYYLVNYQALDPIYVHDPERPGFRKRTDPKLPYLGGFNPPYTYPDLNNMFLAAVKAGPLELPGLAIDPKTAAKIAGAVLIQSFFRPWLFGPLFDPSNPTNPQNNPNWTNNLGKYMMLRPRPKDMGPGFPYPEDAGGDVKNLINSPGYFVGLDPTTKKPTFANNDSLWMDLGAPVMTAPDGTKFKPLFAPLIIDLDNRINLNVHGNIRGRAASQVSNQGWGPWEVNINRILNLAGQPNEWSQIFTDLSSGNTPIEGGRYFYSDALNGHIPLSRFPAANTAGAGDAPHSWAPVDFDGSDETSGGPSGKLNTWLQAVQNGGLWYCSSFPSIPNGYGNGDRAERTNHPLIYNFFNPYQDPTLPDKRNLVFPISNMEAILRYGETNSPGLTSSLFRLCAANFGDTNFEQIQPPAYQQLPPTVGTWTGGASRRNMLTTHSFGLDRPGATPWFWVNKAAVKGGANNILSFGNYGPAGGGTYTGDYHASPPIFPRSDPIPSPPLTTAAAQLQGGDFRLSQDTNMPPNFYSDRRAVGAALSKLDLNRKLTPYPISKSRRNPKLPFHPVTNPVTVFNLGNPAISTQYLQAQADRQQFATDILARLILATGAFNPVTPPPVVGDGSGGFLYPKAQHVYAVAYLAQLAVNIVDFIDGDDIMTGLPWLDVVAPTALDDPLTHPLLHEFRKVATTPTAAGGCGFTSGANQWVFGTELPRVLLNEVYGEFNVIAGDPDPAKNMPATYQVDLWVELYNSLPVEPIPGNATVEPADPTVNYAYLQLPGAVDSGAGLGAYRLELHRPNTVPPGSTPILHQMSNSTGEPDQFFQKTVAGNQPCKTIQFASMPIGAGPVPPSAFIAPSGGLYKGVNGGNTGFYVIGPQNPTGTAKPFPSTLKAKGQKPQPTPPIATFSDPNMSYQVKQGGAGATGLALTQRPSEVPPTVVLQRLANPYLPWNSISNPYVTIDFLELPGRAPAPQPSGLNDAVDTNIYKSYTDSVALEMRVAWGKGDPLNSIAGQLVPETDKVLSPKNQGQPQHTFFHHNGVGRNKPSTPRHDPILSLPLSWLPHPDRQLISPMELLMVSGYKPAELTQRFAQPPTQHFAPWFINPYNQATDNPDPDLNRLFRFFEYVETNNRATGVARGGRIPGLVNLNTVWDPEILLALCDPQPGNYFTDTDIYKPYALEKHANLKKYDSIYWRLIQMRSPSLLNGSSAGHSPDFRDRPFLGHAPPITPNNDRQYPLGTGAANSFWRIDTDFQNRSRLLFQRAPLDTDPDPKNRDNDPSLAHPYNADGIMHKLFNNVTTRSNVFAVWVTVGFFQVTDDTVRPVKLGAEIGKAENRNIRHRMFAIVDRSNLTIDNDPLNANNPGPPVFLEGNRETLLGNPSSPTPVLSIAGAQWNGKTGAAAVLSGFYEGIPWSIAPGSWLQTEVQGGDVQVVSVNPPGTIPDTFNLNKNAVILSPTITLGAGNLAGITSPMYLMPISVVGMPNQKKEFVQGNPGPKPGFNPRNYPWIVRYFSIIH